MLAGGWAVCNYCMQETEYGELARSVTSVLATHKSLLTSLVPLTFDFYCCCNMKSCIFHIFSAHMALWLPCVRGCSSAEVTASLWPYRSACVGPRPGQSDVSPASSGWTTVRPAATRGGTRMTKTSSAPPHVPTALSLVPFHALVLVFRKTRLPAWWSAGWVEEEGDGTERKRQTQGEMDGDGVTVVCTGIWEVSSG